MSRVRHSLSNENTDIITGDGHVHGKFMQVYDKRQLPFDRYNGEGFVFDYDEFMGVSINLIGLEKHEYLNPAAALEKTNAYCDKLPKDGSSNIQA